MIQYPIWKVDEVDPGWIDDGPFFGQPKSPMQAGRARPSRGRAMAWRDLLACVSPPTRTFLSDRVLTFHDPLLT